MNLRLKSIYDKIENEGKNKFLQNEIEIDKTWGNKIFGVTIQVDLGKEIKDLVYKYQKELDQIEPRNLLLLPREFQHISFNQVVFWGGKYKIGTEKTWECISKEFVNRFLNLNHLYKSFNLTFSRLIATPGGIILCGEDENDKFESLRNEFFNKLTFPKETIKFNHIIHTTVSRYKNKLNKPDELLKYIDKQKNIVEMTVKKLILREELVFPSIQTKDIASIELQ